MKEGLEGRESGKEVKQKRDGGGSEGRGRWGDVMNGRRGRWR